MKRFHNLQYGCTQLTRKGYSPFVFILPFILALFYFSPATAGNPKGAHYPGNSSNVFWFILISDTHIGGEMREGNLLDILGLHPLPLAGSNLRWIVGSGYKIIKPDFIVNAGDLTDQLSGAGQDIDQWNEYRQIINGAGLNRNNSRGFPLYFDTPGNHDQYWESTPPTNYINNSIPRRSANNPQRSLVYNTNFGKYHFVTIATPDPGMVIPLSDLAFYCPGQLSEDELSYIGSELEDKNDSNLTFIFGHHGLDGWGVIGGGANTFFTLLDEYDVSLYGYGHTHSAHYIPPFYVNSKGGTLTYNAYSLAEDSQYAIFAVDNDGVSVTNSDINTWPIVLITAPIDSKPGGANPYAYLIPANEKNPIRALIFNDPEYCSIWSAKMLIDSVEVGEMQRVSKNRANHLYNLWEGLWDAHNVSPGDHKITVLAECALPDPYLPPRLVGGSQSITVEVSECSVGIGQGSSNQIVFIDGYKRNKGFSRVGCPTESVYRWGKGYTQDFDGGSGGKGALMLHNDEDTAYWVHGNIWNKYESLGGATKFLGYPLTDEIERPQSSISGARNKYTNFEGGSIELHVTGPNVGLTVRVGNGILNKWKDLGFGGSALGLPMIDEYIPSTSLYKTTGKVCDFEGGHIYWHGKGKYKDQVFEIHGAIDDLYQKLGRTASWLGFPVSDVHTVNGYPKSDFEGGYITTLDGINFQAFSYSDCPYTVTVKISPAGGGLVAKDPDKDTYCLGEQVILNGDPNPGYVLKAWAGVDSKDSLTATVKIKGNRTVTATFTKSSETVSVPGTPTGQTSGTPGKPYSYSTTGSSSNLGHPVQYQFDWKGNGTDLSPWGSASQSKKWDIIGIYNVRARARCATHKTAISDWSPILPVSIGIPVAGISMNAQGKTAYENDTLGLAVAQGQTVIVSFSAARSSDPDGSIASYKWYVNGTIVGSTRDSTFGLGIGTHLIYLEVWDDFGAKGAVGAKIVVTVAQAPQADFSASPTSDVAPLNVQFTDQSTGMITSLQWDFGDGTTSAEKNPSNIYANPGTYTVSLTVTGPGGTNTKTKSDYINVSTASDQWPMFQHDPQHTGRSPYAGPQSAAVKWSFPFNENQISQPVIATDGTIYVVASNAAEDQGRLYAINSNGSLKWRSDDIPLSGCNVSGIAPAAIGADGTIYVGGASGLKAFNENGGLEWVFSPAFVYDRGLCITVAPNGVVYATAGFSSGWGPGPIYGYLLSINPDGTLRWSYEDGGNQLRGTRSPSLADDETIYTTVPGGIFPGILEAFTNIGNIKWAIATATNVSIASIASDGTIYIMARYLNGVNGFSSLYILATKPDGQFLWVKSTVPDAGCDTGVEVTPVIANDGTIIVSGCHSLQGFNVDGSLKLATTFNAAETPVQPIVDREGTIFVGTNSAYKGRIYSIKSDGTIKWSYEILGLYSYFSISPAAISSEGTLYVSIQDGQIPKLYAFGN